MILSLLIIDAFVAYLPCASPCVKLFLRHLITPGVNSEAECSFYLRLIDEETKTSISQFSSVQSLSHVQLLATPWTAAHQVYLFITNFWSLFKLMSIELVMTSSHLILCHPLLLPLSITPSIRVFSNESVLCIRGPKYSSFSFSISPSKSTELSCPKPCWILQDQGRNASPRHWQADYSSLDHQGGPGWYFYCCCSVTRSCPTICYPMDCSLPGLSIHHHLPEFSQVCVHCIDDVTQSFIH